MAAGYVTRGSNAVRNATGAVVAFTNCNIVYGSPLASVTCTNWSNCPTVQHANSVCMLIRFLALSVGVAVSHCCYTMCSTHQPLLPIRILPPAPAASRRVKVPNIFGVEHSHILCITISEPFSPGESLI